MSGKVIEYYSCPSKQVKLLCEKGWKALPLSHEEPCLLLYCASKAAVIHLSRCLAQTLGPEIRVNVIAPGFIADTRWAVERQDREQMRDRAAQTAPLKRVGTAEDVAEAALFLASRADLVSGDVMVVDGGRSVG
jgi:NAD(P)-dependent dehydrogenase (short-subunit alcohol dehydrogenase family)